VKKMLAFVLEEADPIESMRVMMDDDADPALGFLKRHLRGRARELLEGG
jgi:hypothetical protein